MKPTAANPKALPEQAAVSEEPSVKDGKARMEFVAADVEAAGNFLDLARFDFANGETEHAVRLVEHAERAAEVVDDIVERFPAVAAPALRNKLQALYEPIREIKERAF